MIRAPVVMCQKCGDLYLRGLAQCSSCGHRCEHEWEELTRARLRHEPGRVIGKQQCVKCGTTDIYQKDENE